MHQAPFQALYMSYLIELLQQPFDVGPIIIPTLYSKESETQRSSVTCLMSYSWDSNLGGLTLGPASFTVVSLITLETGFEIFENHLPYKNFNEHLVSAFGREGPIVL